MEALLTTTRAVRRRLDYDRPVEREVILDCIRQAQQAPTGGNAQGWRWIVVEDADTRAALAGIYRRSGEPALRRGLADAGSTQTRRVYASALFLMERLARVPVHVIPCITGGWPEQPTNANLAGRYGSIFPAVWSFQLALRARGARLRADHRAPGRRGRVRRAARRARRRTTGRPAAGRQHHRR